MLFCSDRQSLALGLLSLLSLGVSPSLAGIVKSPQPARRLPASPSYRGRNHCPELCSISGPLPGNWSVFRSQDQIQFCEELMLEQFNVHDNVDDRTIGHRINACAQASGFGNASTSTASTADQSTIPVTYEIGWWTGTADQLATAHVEALADSLGAYLEQGHGAAMTAHAAAVNRQSKVRAAKTSYKTSLNSSEDSLDGPVILFARYGTASAGLYVGGSLQSAAVGSSALRQLGSQLSSLGTAGGSVVMQLCGAEYDGAHTFGCLVTSNGSFAPTQAAIQTWAEGRCVAVDASTAVNGSAVLLSPLISALNSTVSNMTASAKFRRHAPLWARDDCTTVQVESGDGCASLAEKCGISGADFTTYNPGDEFCATLQPKQHVCCSAGTLPDFAPKPNGDGSCATYTVVADDTCSGIAADNSLTVADLETYNQDTWGWNGCDRLLLGTIMCLSTGTAPMPAQDANAVCGPTVVGTERPTDGTNISALNPCPLNACCDVWGQCGITADFCTDTGTGAPGTAASGTNGCISNCGTDIVQSGSGSFLSIGYFEGFNLGRQCLYQDSQQIDATQYTHLHFSFATISDDYTSVSVGDVLGQYEFGQFQRLSGTKRILTFGGWAFSTDPSTYNIFRQGVTAANRVTMATTIANFVRSNNLDGVDIDWEYPGAPDIPGIPAGNKDDGTNYLAFLIVLKNLLPGKSVSIAAPASYWYLKGFPINDIGQVVDYIVYMTYDLHGQWDYGSQYAQEGCPNGNCLRSDVNLTETLTSLAMVTKAGVPSSKIVVGVTSYGRSFNMAEAGCYSEQCTFTGSASESDATKGICTDTAGYISDAEIKEILQTSSSAKRDSRVTASFVDEASNSNILVYDDTQWVGWMDADIRTSRIAQYQSLGMGGATNWAIDLEDYNEAPARADSWSAYISSIESGSDPNSVGSRTGTWVNVTCDDTSVSDIRHLTPYERWTGMDCEDAWNDVLSVWKEIDRPAAQLNFTASVSDTIHGPENADCGSSSRTSNCDQTLQCIGFISKDTGAAGYEIWNSMVLVHEMFMSYVDAISSAASEIINPQLSLFEDKFAPVPKDDDKWLEILLIIVDLVGTVAVSAYFNFALAALPFFKSNKPEYDTTKDTAKALVGFTTGLAGTLNGKGAEGWTAESQDELSAYLGQAVFAWANTTETALASLFDGTDDSISTLYALIKDGQMIEGMSMQASATISALQQTQLETVIAKALFAVAIPTAWGLTDKYAAVIDSGYPCGEAPEDEMKTYFDGDVMDKTGACYGGEQYYLGYVHKGKLYTPPGIDSLDGTNFGGLDVGELISGSVRTYEQNGNHNGGSTVDPADSGSFSDLMQADITTPGYVRIPVCSAEVAKKAISEGNTAADYYPCNNIKTINDCGDSTFVDETTTASPTVEDCQKLVEQLQDTSTYWTTINQKGYQRAIATYGTCKFGVEGNGGGIPSFNTGGQDVVDLVTASIAQFSWQGLVGAKGVMSCQGSSRHVTVTWGLY